jgi:uncharacterized MnhB-related membrane protein
MPEPVQSPEAISNQLLQFSRAVRFALAAIVIGFSYPGIRIVSFSGNVEQIYHDMLGNHPLPESTQFLFRYQEIFCLLSFLFPLLAIASIFLKEIVRSLYVSGVLFLLCFALFYFEWHAAIVPMFDIVRGMQSTAGQ